MDSPWSSRFRVATVSVSSDSSSVQVVALAPGSEGAPNVNSVMNLRTTATDGDGNEYLPC